MSVRNEIRLYAAVCISLIVAALFFGHHSVGMEAGTSPSSAQPAVFVKGGWGERELRGALAPLLSDVLETTIQTMIRNELGPLIEQLSRLNQAGNEPPLTLDARARIDETYMQADATLETAIASGFLDRESALAIESAAMMLPTQEQLRLLRKRAEAINSGQLQLP